MKLNRLWLTSPFRSLSLISTVDNHSRFVMNWERPPRQFTTTMLAFTDKKTPDNQENTSTSSGDTKDADSDGYSLGELKSSDQKVRLSQFKNYIETNSYYEKYKARIVAAQKASPKTFLAMVENVIPLKKKDRTSHERLRASNAARKALSEIMKIDMLMELPRDDILFVWQEYHKSIKSIGAAMSGSAYDRTEPLAKKYSTFTLPLPKNGGYEFYLVQYGGESFHFTPLIKYHMYKENSPVCLTLNYYKELKPTKDLVLMRGEIDKEILLLEEAQFLAVQFNYYYAEGNAHRVDLLKQFNSNASEFDHEMLIEELKNLTKQYCHMFPTLSQASDWSSN